MKKTPYNFRIDNVLLDELHSYAVSESTTASNVIRTAIYAYLRNMTNAKNTNSKYV